MFIDNLQKKNLLTKNLPPPFIPQDVWAANTENEYRTFTKYEGNHIFWKFPKKSFDMITVSKECFVWKRTPTKENNCFVLHHHLPGFKGRGSEEEEIYSQVKYRRTSDQCKTGKKSWMTIDTLYHCPSENHVTKSMTTWSFSMENHFLIPDHFFELCIMSSNVAPFLI